MPEEKDAAPKIDAPAESYGGGQPGTDMGGRHEGFRPDGRDEPDARNSGGMGAPAPHVDPAGPIGKPDADGVENIYGAPESAHPAAGDDDDVEALDATDEHEGQSGDGIGVEIAGSGNEIAGTSELKE